MAPSNRQQGIQAALASAFFMGVMPIIGKYALSSGFTPLAVISIRTGVAAILMLTFMFLWKRAFFFIYPVGLVGCLLAGLINGLGSILYYTALSRLDASIGHLLYSFYPVFVALWLLLDRQALTRLTIVRLIVSAIALVMLLNRGNNGVDLGGALMMIGSAILYALHLLINQRILFEAPAPTVTLYTLIGMGVTVGIAYLAFDRSIPAANVSWGAVITMALVTFFSRFTLFLGVKHLGGLQTALLGLGEIFITLILAQVLLGESLTLVQWFGAGLLGVSLVLIGMERIQPQRHAHGGWLAWLNPRIPGPDFPWRPEP